MCRLICLLNMILYFSATSQAGVITGQVSVDGRSNIFGAGLATPPGESPGILPPSIALPVGARSVAFTDVSGAVSFDYWAPGTRPFYGPDGGSFAPSGAPGLTNISSLAGISGLQFSRNTFLAGVFTGELRSSIAPPRLNLFDGNFVSLTPELQQTFFIGDGLTDSGVQQRFEIPTGATRLHLGLVDGFSFQEFTVSGLPRFYDDNGGAYFAHYAITAVPEPTSFMIFGLVGLVTTGGRRRGSLMPKNRMQDP